LESLASCFRWNVEDPFQTQRRRTVFVIGIQPVDDAVGAAFVHGARGAIAHAHFQPQRQVAAFARGTLGGVEQFGAEAAPLQAGHNGERVEAGGGMALAIGDDGAALDHAADRHAQHVRMGVGQKPGKGPARNLVGSKTDALDFGQRVDVVGAAPSDTSGPGGC
jgi:hypothetical protein